MQLLRRLRSHCFLVQLYVVESSDEGSSHTGASALRVVMHIMPNTINGDTESESEYIFFMVRAHSQWLNQHVCYIRCVYTSTRSRIRILIWITTQRWSEYNICMDLNPVCLHVNTTNLDQDLNQNPCVNGPGHKLRLHEHYTVKTGVSS